MTTNNAQKARAIANVLRNAADSAFAAASGWQDWARAESLQSRAQAAEELANRAEQYGCDNADSAYCAAAACALAAAA